jgi:hypothetical protein
LRTGPFDHKHEQNRTQAVIQTMIVAHGWDSSRHLCWRRAPTPDDAFHRSVEHKITHIPKNETLTLMETVEAARRVRACVRARVPVDEGDPPIRCRSAEGVAGSERWRGWGVRIPCIPQSAHNRVVLC